MSLSPRFDNRITRLLGVEVPIANSPMGFVAGPDLVAAVASRRWDRSRPRFRRHRQGPQRHQARPRPDRPALRRQPADRVREGPGDRRHARRRRRSLRDDVGRLARRVHAGPEVGRPQGAARGHLARHRQRGGRCRGRRARRRGHRGCRPQGHRRGGVDGAAAAHRPPPRRAAHHGRRHRRRHLDGRRFALGAEGVQMGTRMLASVESHVHGGSRTRCSSRRDRTVLVNRQNGKPLRSCGPRRRPRSSSPPRAIRCGMLLRTCGLTYTRGSSRTRSRRSARLQAGSTRCPGGRDHARHGRGVRRGRGAVGTQYLVARR